MILKLLYALWVLLCACVVIGLLVIIYRINEHDPGFLRLHIETFPEYVRRAFRDPIRTMRLLLVTFAFVSLALTPLAFVLLALAPLWIFRRWVPPANHRSSPLSVEK
jgi:hypothetical protein